MRRIAFAGAGGRGTSMYAAPMARLYHDVVQPVGVFDVNPLRGAMMCKYAGMDVPVFTSFDAMLKAVSPDTVVVTTIDRTHHEYAAAALRGGCDVILEKPMAIDENKIKSILAAERETGRSVAVTFNVRFMPFAARIKRLMLSGAVGTALSVHLEWTLDTRHGADYFRRWHRYMKNTGGLLVHKSTHHFDLVNWLIADTPEAVSAFGALRYYGKNQPSYAERCFSCPRKSSCSFYFDIGKDPFTRSFYLDCESADGYFRDRCVFAPDIDIYDTVSASVLYRGGAVMSYSLNAHALYEGFRLVVNGTEGRIEATCRHGSVGAYAGRELYDLKLLNRDEELIDIVVPCHGGAHGGGDERLLRMLLRPPEDDPLGQMAGTSAGAASALIGIAANRSIATGATVRIDELMA